MKLILPIYLRTLDATHSKCLEILIIIISVFKLLGQLISLTCVYISFVEMFV